MNKLELLKEAQNRANWKRWKESPREFIEECLWIYPKDPSLGQIKLKLNAAQEVVVAEFERQMKEEGRVRIIVSKYRQAGFSTISSALIFHRAIFYEATRAVLISLDKPTTESIFSMSQTFYQAMPESVKPGLSASNKREMKFRDNDSQFSCFTSGADHPARGTTNTAMLADEIAFFQQGGKVLAGIFQSVSNADGTIIIINSTSNGAQGVYYDLWMKAERGEGQYKPLFVPWFLQDEYTLKVPEGEVFSPQERKVQKLWDLSDGQLYWRKIKIAETNTIIFKQEYPFTAEESFIVSGSNVFDIESIKKYEPYPCISLRRYNDAFAGFDENEEGELEVWEPPVKDKKYLIGADVAGGVGGDYSVAVVMDSDRNIVAMFRSNRIDPVFFGKMLYYLGRWYNNCLVACESNSIGLATIQQLFSMNYPNLYQQKKVANTQQYNDVNSFGFKTTVATKGPIISNLQSMIKDEDIMIPSQMVLDELRNYILVGDSQKMGAAPGHHDDTVMALAIACEAYRTHSGALTNKKFSFDETIGYGYVDGTNWL